MIESVSTLPVQSSALRSAPQSQSNFSSSSLTNPSNFVSSRVRVDNLQNVAILEYRSSQGDVVRQYPTEAQIQAFKRAERLATEHAQTVKLEQPAGGGGHTAAPAPVTDTNSQTPSTADIVAAAASYSPPAAPGGNSTQSTTA